jgi:hypothetical protein
MRPRRGAVMMESCVRIAAPLLPRDQTQLEHAATATHGITRQKCVPLYYDLPTHAAGHVSQPFYNEHREFFRLHNKLRHIPQDGYVFQRSVTTTKANEDCPLWKMTIDAELDQLASRRLHFASCPWVVIVKETVNHVSGAWC